MRFLLAIILTACLASVHAQVPPAIQWQKCLGGSAADGANDIYPTSDGGYILAGGTSSTDNGITGNHGKGDAWIVKTDALGIIQWQKCYGGSEADIAIRIRPTPDGGYFFVGHTRSFNGDVRGQHGLFPWYDIWAVKLDAVGTLQWQKCFGGTLTEVSYSLELTNDGGYIIGGQSNSSDGDVVGLHSTRENDTWILKLDAAGNLEWQRPFGGSGSDDVCSIVAGTDGGYVMASVEESSDGDVLCNNFFEEVQVTKFDNNGTIVWRACSLQGQVPYIIQTTSDGGYIIGGHGINWIINDPSGQNIWVMKITAGGTLQWEKTITGQKYERVLGLKQTADGGYILMAETNSPDMDSCNNKGLYDLMLLKLDGSGTLEWKKRYGGSDDENPREILLTSDGGYMVAGFTKSKDGDVSGNHGGYDLWMTKFKFPGTAIVPSITIAANKTITCPGGAIRFIATTVNGGENPGFQWKLNGMNTATDNDTVFINVFNTGDMINCVLTSSSACVNIPTALSNQITVQVDPSLLPKNFLPPDQEICSFQKLELKPSGTYKTYLWNTNAVTPTITVSQPGTYWLNVISNDDCPGSDTVIVTPKECLKGFYMPTAFSPNNNGKNDLLKPYLGGIVKQYKFAVYNRWGELVFQTTDLFKGWDGKYKGQEQDARVFVWYCTYQLEGESVKTEKGTVVVIK
ncbi:MAG: gliding motility-associated C-terminal domain-containing protein [Chitinophagaceae bacterium]